jgi:hypothetical protein
MDPEFGGESVGMGSYWGPARLDEIKRCISEELDRRLKELGISLDEKIRKMIEQFAFDWAAAEIEYEEEEEGRPVPIEGFVGVAVEVALQELGIIRDEDEEEW